MRHAWLLLAALLGGCVAKPRCGTGPLRLELRDGNGALQLRVAGATRTGELDLCDAAGQRVGALGRQGDALVLYDRSNAELLRAATPATLELDGPGGPRMRIYREGGALRVLNAEGVPYGQILERDGAAWASDPGGSPIGKASRRDADAVVAAPDGAVRAFVVPSPGLVAAGVLVLDGLPLAERVFVAAHLGRGPLQP